MLHSTRIERYREKFKRSERCGLHSTRIERHRRVIKRSERCGLHSTKIKVQAFAWIYSCGLFRGFYSSFLLSPFSWIYFCGLPTTTATTTPTTTPKATIPTTKQRETAALQYKN